MLLSFLLGALLALNQSPSVHDACLPLQRTLASHPRTHHPLRRQRSLPCHLRIDLLFWPAPLFSPITCRNRQLLNQDLFGVAVLATQLYLKVSASDHAQSA